MTHSPDVPKLVTIDASAPLEEICEIMARDGGVIVSNLLSPEMVERFLKNIEPHYSTRKVYTSMAHKDELSADFFPDKSVRVYGLLGKIPNEVGTVMRLPVWQGIMDHFLSDTSYSWVGEKRVPQKSGYMLAATAAMRLVPGCKAQPLHRDHMPYQTRPDPNNPLFTPMIGCLIAGTRCTEKNGATAVIPGSHLWPQDRMPLTSEKTHAEMEPGSALFTFGSTYHGAGANNADEGDADALRTVFAVFGQRDYFRADQEEMLTTPIEIARQLPEDILRLAGYYKSVGGVGYVEDHQDVVDYLGSEGIGMGIGQAPSAVKVTL